MFKEVQVPIIPSEEPFKRPSEFRSLELKNFQCFLAIFSVSFHTEKLLVVGVVI